MTGLKGTFKMGAMAEVPRHADDESAPASVDDLLVSLVSSARLGVNGFSRDGSWMGAHGGMIQGAHM